MIRYCRTCLEFITGLGYFSVDETIHSCSIPIRRQLETCIPGMNMNIMKNAFICSTCSTSLAYVHQFYEKCMRSEAKIREIVQKVELMNREKSHGLGFEQHNIKTEQVEMDSHTEMDLDVEFHGMGYRDFYANETEQYNDLDKDRSTAIESFGGNLRETRDFFMKEIVNCNDSFKDVSDSRLAFSGNLVNPEETGKYNDLNDITESTKSNESRLMDVDTQTIGRLKTEDFSLESFPIDSKLYDCCVKLTRLPDKIVSTEAAVIVVSGKFMLKCVTCSSVFKTNEVFDNHPCRKNITHSANKLLYHCINCVSAFPNVTEYIHHMHQSHNGEIAVKCGICGIGIKHARNLKRHLVTHTGLKPFKCSLCDKHFTSQHSVEYHMRSHSGEKPIQLNKSTFQCGKCNRAFTTTKTFKQHLCQDKSSGSVVKPPRVLYKCTVCDGSFLRYPSYKLHMLETHSDEVSVKCSICDLVLKHAFYLKRHMQIHAGKTPFNCNLCHERYEDKHKLSYHLRNVHVASEGEFKCIHCYYIFNTYELFKEHLCEGSIIIKCEV